MCFMPKANYHIIQGSLLCSYMITFEHLYIRCTKNTRRTMHKNSSISPLFEMLMVDSKGGRGHYKITKAVEDKDCNIH